MTRTGKRRYRVDWFGRVILQLEWQGPVFDYMAGVSDTQSIWRDARPEDIMEHAV